MRKILYILFLLIITVCSCDPQAHRKDRIAENSSTDDLMSFFRKYALEGSLAKSDTLKKEIFYKRERELKKYIDSVAIFNNLKGILKTFEFLEEESYLAYHIILYYQENSYIRLDCGHFVNKDSLDFDEIYIKLKYLPKNSTVYFDGIFSINLKEKMPVCFNDTNDLTTSFIYPEYYFHLIEVSTTKNATLSKKLKKILKNERQLFYYYNEEDIDPKYTTPYSTLSSIPLSSITEKEDEYNDRYLQKLFEDQ